MIIKTLTNTLNESSMDFGRIGSTRGGIVDAGTECQVQASGDHGTEYKALYGSDGGTIIVVTYAPNEPAVYMDSAFEGGRSSRGVRNFSYWAECDNPREALKIANKIWDAVEDEMDLDDSDYSVDAINSLVRKLVSRYGFESV